MTDGRDIEDLWVVLSYTDAGYLSARGAWPTLELAEEEAKRVATERKRRAWVARAMSVAEPREASLRLLPGPLSLAWRREEETRP